MRDTMLNKWVEWEVLDLCGRYSLSPEESLEIAKIVAQVEGRIKVGEIYPTNAVPVLMEAGAELVPEVMNWGFPRFPGKSGHIINARSETVMERSLFRKSTLERRCIVPTTGFYEWGTDSCGGKMKYRFRLPNGDSALYLAGIWNAFSGEKRCVILTTAANASMDGIHHRMPVLLSREELRDWVEDLSAAGEILERVPAMLLHEPWANK